jgi:hypothetical protein
MEPGAKGISDPQPLNRADAAKPPPTDLRVWLLGLAALLAVIAVYGICRIQHEYPSHWARVLPQVATHESPQIDLQKALQQISDAKGPKTGASLLLAEFVQSNGQRVRVVLVEGEMFDRSIEPREVWHTLGHDMLLVSSVDERRSGVGSLSSPTTAGCAIVAEERITQELGTTSIDACKWVYRDSFHITRLARLSAIVESTLDPSQAPCWARYGIAAPEGDYQTCVGNAVSSGLGSLFSQIHDLRSVDAIVLPAIGTSAGKLSKAGFYNKLLPEILVGQLKWDYYIPPTIYLQVRRLDPDNRWLETQIAIAGAVANAVMTWDVNSEHKSPDSEWLSLTGVAIGSCLMLIALACGARFRILANLLPVVAQARPLMIISWLSAAVGLVSVFKAFVAFFPGHFNPYLQVAAGVLTALLCGPLLRAGQAVDEALKGDRPHSSTTPGSANDSSANKSNAGQG